MTCAKAYVPALLVLSDGRRFGGANDCANPQASCPRAPGEGYAKCRSVCRQEAHAEIAAMATAKLAGADIRGGVMYIGWHRACPDCQGAMGAEGVRWGCRDSR